MKSNWTLEEAVRSLAGAGAEPGSISRWRWLQFIEPYAEVLAIAPHWHRNKDGKAQDHALIPLDYRLVNRRHFQRWADAMGLLAGLDKKRVSAVDPPSAPALRMAVATGTKLWALDEAAETTSSAVWPAFEPAAEGYVTRLRMLRPGGALVSPDPEQWAELESIWTGLPKLELPIAIADWKAYEDTFESSQKGPRMWLLRPEVCEPADAMGRQRIAAKSDHLRKLRAEIAAGRIAIYHPQKPTRARPEDKRINNTYRVRLDGIARLCSALDIDAVRPAEKGRIPSILDTARPAAVPPGLVDLDDADLVLRRPGFGSERSPFICTVGDFRADVEHRIQRQKEKGQFTFDEAVQILAEAHPEKDAERFATLLRNALGELKTLDGADRLPLVRGETLLEDFDLLTISELDAWSLKTVGCRFPGAEGQTEDQTDLSSADQGGMTQSPALDCLSPTKGGEVRTPVHTKSAQKTDLGSHYAKRWTPERLKELDDYRTKHGTKEAAKWAGVSTSRVRALLPGEKPQPKGYSAFRQRIT